MNELDATEVRLIAGGTGPGLIRWPEPTYPGLPPFPWNPPYPGMDDLGRIDP